MIFVEPYAELLEEENPLIKIERVGRLCYKSESEYTEETAVKFVNRLIRNKHFAMLEHAVFTFVSPDIIWKSGKYESYGVAVSTIYNKKHIRGGQLITCNLRFILEHKISRFMSVLMTEYPIFKELELSKFFPSGVKSDSDCPFSLVKNPYLMYKDYVEDILKHVYLTFHIVCDRGVSHEIVRHRVASYAQESTRYCNYGKDDSIKFIEPCWEMTGEERRAFNNALDKAEEVYTYLVNDLKVAPQKARYVLPNGLKTELFMTASVTEYDHFLRLRYYGATGSPHPQMKQVASYMLNAIEHLL